MIFYILKCSACLALLLAFYKLVLEKESMHHFKRFYLLGALLLSICIPLVTFTHYIEPTGESANLALTNDIPFQIEEATTETITNYLPNILWTVYGIGVLLFGFKFIRNLYKLNYRIHHNPIKKVKNINNVLLKDLIVPHTFFNYIFFNKQKFETHDIPKEVFWHEETHASQKHSIDVLLIEILQVLFWFNPLIYSFKHVIKLNHEFLADQGVLNKGINTANYQETILAFSSNATHPELANAINYSLIKKRFTVMKTQTSKKAIWLRTLVLLPLLAITLYSFSNTKTEYIKLDTHEVDNSQEQETSNPTKDEVENLNSLKMFYTNSKEAYYKNVTFKVNAKTENKIETKTFNQLTPEEVNMLANPPSKPVKKSPKQIELNKWKDAKMYGIWVDGQRIKNSILNQYKPSDFDLYYESKLAKNAKNYGKHFFQISLYTKEFYLKNYEEKFAPLSKGVVIHLSNNNQEGATKDQVKEYNVLAKKYNNMPEDKMIIRQKDLERLKYLYHLMSEDQKENAQPFPNIPAPPAPVAIKVVNTVKQNTPPPPPPPVPVNATPEQKAKYKKIHEEYKRKYRVEGHRVRSINNKKGKIAPPPPPIPANATEAQKRKYEAAIKAYKAKAKKLIYVREIEQAKATKLAKVKEEHEARRVVRVKELKERVAERKELSEDRKKGIAAKKVLIAKERKLKGKKEALIRLEEREKMSDERKAELIKDKLRHVKEREVIREKRRADMTKEKKRRQEERIMVREVKDAPPSSLDEIIKLSENGAIFYLEGKEIPSEKAIKTIKRSKRMSIYTLDRDSKQPKVYLSSKPIVREN